MQSHVSLSFRTLMFDGSLHSDNTFSTEKIPPWVPFAINIVQLGVRPASWWEFVAGRLVCLSSKWTALCLCDSNCSLSVSSCYTEPRFNTWAPKFGLKPTAKSNTQNTPKYSTFFWWHDTTIRPKHFFCLVNFNNKQKGFCIYYNFLFYKTMSSPIQCFSK